MKVIKFGSVWCVGCIVMSPRWKEIEKELPWLETEYVDGDENIKMVQKYEIGNLPTFVFLDKKDKEFLRLQGEIAKDELIKICTENREK